MESVDSSVEGRPLPNMGQRLIVSFRRISVAQIAQPLALFLLLALILTGLKVIRIDQQYGDTAMYLQVVHNIATRGQPVSNVFAANDEIGKRKVARMTAAEMAVNPFPPMPELEESHFAFHANYIFYPIAVISMAIPANILLMSLFAFSFVGLLAIAYLILRSSGVATTACVLFCLLVVTHPVWADGLEWQFYPERMFVFFGFLLLWLGTRSDARRSGLITTALLCALISERAAVIGGLALALYVALYWKRGVTDRYFKGGLGIALFAYGYFILKVVLTNREYSSFLPTSLHALIANLTNPLIFPNLVLFLVINAFLLVLALFEWRCAVIAFVTMLPNIVGNLGGAEKVGWMTHYHDMYFPVLVWAAMLGFKRLYFFCTERKLAPLFYAFNVALILALGSIPEFARGRIEFQPSNLANEFLPRTYREAKIYFGPAGRALWKYRAEMQAFVPKGSVVTAPEWAFTSLYQDRTIEFFPIDIDHADYAVLKEVPGPSGIEYQGFNAIRGADEQHQINAVLTARMKRDGYDFAHALVIPQTGGVVVKRLH